MPFASLGLPEPITRSVRAAGYAEPTPIQRRAIPLILPGHDLVAAAQTGSGKTAAFLLPILVRLLEGPRALRALVLVPTRELAAQVDACGRDYARFTGVRVGAVYGGVPIKPQAAIAKDRRSQVGTGERSEKIRTYNFPQSRITDHRINFTTHQLVNVLNGDLGELIDQVVTHFQAEKLKEATTV